MSFISIKLRSRINSEKDKHLSSAGERGGGHSLLYSTDKESKFTSQVYRRSVELLFYGWVGVVVMYMGSV